MSSISAIGLLFQFSFGYGFATIECKKSYSFLLIEKKSFKMPLVRE